MKRSYRRKIEEFQIGDIVRHYSLRPKIWYVIAELRSVSIDYEYAYCYEMGAINTFYRHTMHISNLVKLEEDDDA